MFATMIAGVCVDQSKVLIFLLPVVYGLWMCEIGYATMVVGAFRAVLWRGWWWS
jgi:hypothetical protein